MKHHLTRPGRPAILLLLLLGVIILSLSPLDRTRTLRISFFRPRGDGLDEVLESAPAAPAAPLPRTAKSANIPLQAILDAITGSIAASAATFDTVSARSQLGLNLGNVTMEGYLSDLQRTYDEFFSSQRDDLLPTVLSYLSLLPHPSSPLPNNIYTTGLTPPDDLPEQFQSWATENKDWRTLFVEDAEIDRWLGAELPGAGVLEEMKALGGERGVVRADLFRYLVLLLNGGVYTDTDTACVRPIDTWTKNHDTHTLHPLLNSLLHLLPFVVTPDGSDVAHVSHEAESIGDTGPSLIVAIESDSPKTSSDWRADSFIRGLQVVQWTLAAKRGHPVMLDVLGRGLRQAKEVRIAEETGTRQAPNILDWTGPGVFTDAVLRYLLVRYGVHPSTLSGLVRPLRIGDVIVMPLHSFRADASEGFQGDYRVVWHGFFGSWKGDV